MSSNVKKWKRTNKRVMSLLNSSFEENTLNTDIDGDDHATLEVNSLNDSFVSTNEFMLSSSGSNSELNSESHSNSDGEPKNSSPNSLVSDSNSDVMYHSQKVSLSQRLAACAIKNNWSRDSVTDLLKILCDEGLELPKDARTLLKTPRDVKTFQKCGGEYCYFGIQKCIEQIAISA